MNEQTRKEFELAFEIISLEEAEELWDINKSFCVLRPDGTDAEADNYKDFDEIKEEVNNGALVGWAYLPFC